MVDASTFGVMRTRGVNRLVLGLLVALSGTVAVSAWAGPGGHEGGFGGQRLFMGSPERTTRMVDRMLDSVDATDVQRTQIKQIVQAAAADLKAQHQSARGLREQGLQLFTAPVVDARAVETLRQQSLAQHDQASKRITQALLDISAVLTPDQRVKLVARIQQHKHRHERPAR